MENSYEMRHSAEPNNHMVYSAYISQLQLNTEHLNDLLRRGLNGELINKAQYRSKPAKNSRIASDTIGYLDGNFSMDKVPGFFRSGHGHLEAAPAVGMIIPSRDVNGRISSLLIRNDKPKIDEAGKPKNKYVAFSSTGKLHGSRVWSTTHCPIIKGDPIKVSGTTVRITEGILKADVTTALSDIYCLGFPGLNMPPDLAYVLEKLEISTVHIAFDSGEDDCVDMVRARAKLIRRLREIGVDVIVELWDYKYGKGVDDVLKNGHADKIRSATEEEIEEFLRRADLKDPENGDYVYVVDHEKFYQIHNFKSWTKSQFMNRFGFTETKDINKLIATGYRQVDGLTYLPQGEKFVVIDGYEYLNIWRDPGIIPLEGDVQPFLDHLAYLFPDQKDRKNLHDYIAYNTQYPGRKMSWALVIIGLQGIGKSFFTDVFKGMFGAGNIATPTNEQLHEKYSGWQKGCHIVVIEELKVRGKVDLMNKLKPMITQEWTKVREMHVESYDYPNRYNVMAFTNHNDALLIDQDDRRYCILKSPAEPMGSQYYRDLWAWINNPRNIQALLYYFLNVDLSGFEPKGRAPSSSAKVDMMARSLSALEEWVIGHIEDHAWPFNRSIVAIRHLKRPEICPRGFEQISDKKWADALQKAGAVRYPAQVPMADKSRVTVWLIGDDKQGLLRLDAGTIARIYKADSLSADQIVMEQRDKNSKADMSDVLEAYNPIRQDKPQKQSAEDDTSNPVEDSAPL